MSPEFWEKCGGLEDGIARLFFCYAGQPRGGVPKKDLAQSFLRPRSYPRTHQGGSLNRMSQVRVRGGPTMAQTSPKLSKQENANERTKVAVACQGGGMHAAFFGRRPHRNPLGSEGRKIRTGRLERDVGGRAGRADGLVRTCS